MMTVDVAINLECGNPFLNEWQANCIVTVVVVDGVRQQELQLRRGYGASEIAQLPQPPNISAIYGLLTAI